MDPIDEYLMLVEKVYILFSDSMIAFHDEIEKIKELQDNIRGELANHGTLLTQEELDQKAIHYFHKDPVSGQLFPIAKTTQEQWKLRLSSTGENINFIGNMCIVLIYQYWEDHYREIFAKKLGFTCKDELKSDLFGDIGCLRKSIIHHRSISLPDVEKCKILIWFQVDEPIIIDKPKMNEVITRIRAELTKYRV